MPRQSQAWLTQLACVACAGIWVVVNGRAGGPTWDDFKRFGVCPDAEIWAGSYWSLIASVFMHVQLWHLVLNLYWLWRLGSVLERTIGSRAYLIFFLASGFGFVLGRGGAFGGRVRRADFRS